MADKTTIDWQDAVPSIFRIAVSKADSRYTLKAPWRDKQSDEIVATNGHICIRGPWQESYRLPEPNGVIPPYKELKWDRKLYAKDPLPAIELKELLLIECEECEGLGSRFCDLDHEHECKICDGTGERAEYIAVRYKSGLQINAKYVVPLLVAGGKMFQSNKEATKSQVLVEMDDFTALLAPLDPEAEECTFDRVINA